MLGTAVGAAAQTGGHHGRRLGVRWRVGLVPPLVSSLLASHFNHDGSGCLARCHAVAVLASGQRPEASGQWLVAIALWSVANGQLSAVEGDCRQQNTKYTKYTKYIKYTKYTKL